MIDRRRLVLGIGAAAAALAHSGTVDAIPLRSGFAAESAGSPILGWVPYLLPDGHLRWEPLTEEAVEHGIFIDSTGHRLAVGDKYWRSMVRSEDRMREEIAEVRLLA